MGQNKKEIQVIILPFHGQGHINTMVQFAKRLAWKGVHVTIATTTSATKKMSQNISSFNDNSITLVSIYDDSNEPNVHFKERMVRFEAEAAPNLTNILVDRIELAAGKKCLLVYHSSLSWALKVARQQNIMAAVFFSISTASFVGYYRLYLETQGISLKLEVPSILPSPDLLCKHHSHGRNNENSLHPMILWLLRDYSQIIEADFSIINSFDKLEDEVVKWMSNIIEVKTIGPTLPSSYLDKQIANDVDYGFNQYKPTNEDCIKWLNTQPTSSIVYISFGSVVCPSVEQMVEILEALKLNSSRFLWVMRESEQEKLPVNFMSGLSESTLVVPWCLQLDVLRHDAVGCFMSHCGWNSTIEALSSGVPVLAMPQFLDQFVDANFVDRVWSVGITPSPDDKGLVAREEISRCLEEIMSGPRAQKIKENVVIWKESAKEALDNGGSSDRHIDDIIRLLTSS